MKLIYVIAALAMLAMLIPAMAVPVSAGANTMTIELQYVHMVNGQQVTEYLPDGAANSSGLNEGFNVAGSIIRVTAPGEPSQWNLDVVTTHSPEPPVAYAAAHWVGGDPNSQSPKPTTVLVQGTWGEATISAVVSDIEYTAKKKWGMITGTDIDDPQTTTVTWNEESKSWFADGSISDTVMGSFLVNGVATAHAAQGAILNWYLISGDESISLTPDFAGALKTTMANKADAKYVQFIDPTESANWPYYQWHHTTDGTNGWLGTYVQNITDKTGVAGVEIGAWFEEAVQIVVVPEYPNYPNRKVTPEITSFNFGTTEMEVVPQVRWTGEKIVLEANFGAGMGNKDVLFYFQEPSVGTLEGLTDDNEAATVWTQTNSDGVACAILFSQVPGQSDVIAALYPRGRNAPVTNQYAFKVYFLNFESLELTNVVGKRVGHDEGLWEPANPWQSGYYDDTKADNYPDMVGPPDYDYNLRINDPNAPDVVYENLNVSQDTLLRAKVRGYFTNTTPSTRTVGVIPNKDPKKPGLTLPAGRWILPDDWDVLATLDNSNYEQTRRFWDIMDAPNDTLNFPYAEVVNDAGIEITGPFTPGIELMTPYGWDIHAYSDRQTVVPNGALDLWDAPMPPAKIILDILDRQKMIVANGKSYDIGDSGYFKTALKTDIYYSGPLYTAPFYQVLIPAHQAIPPFNTQFGGGYDWNSFDGTHGPYEFWTIINRPEGAPVTSADPAQHPTKVQVYSDNHGEAMVWLNGNWNLDFSPYDVKGGVGIPYGSPVGSTVVEAQSDYPYVRSQTPIYSNQVTKDWWWGGEVAGVDQYTGGAAMVLTGGHDEDIVFTTGTTSADDDAWGISNDHALFVWVTDRDGLIDGVLNAKVEWMLSGEGNPYLTSGNIDALNGCNWSQYLQFRDGFLRNDANPGHAVAPNSYGIVGVSYLRAPTSEEMEILVKTYPTEFTTNKALAVADPDNPLFYAGNFAVAAIDVTTTAGGDNTASVKIFSADFGGPGAWIIRTINFDAADSFPLDDNILPGDANVDKVVNMLDITAVERYLLGLDSYYAASADANFNNEVDMGDVVKIERIYLGLE